MDKSISLIKNNSQLNNQDNIKQEKILDKIKKIKDFTEYYGNSANEGKIKDFINKNIKNDEILNKNSSIFKVTNTRSQTYLYIIFYTLVKNNNLDIDYNDFINFYKKYGIDLNTIKVNVYFEEMINDSKKNNKYDLNFIKRNILLSYPENKLFMNLSEIKEDNKKKQKYKENFFIYNKNKLFSILTASKVTELINKKQSNIFNDTRIEKGIKFGINEKIITPDRLESLSYNQLRVLNKEFFNLIKNDNFTFDELIENPNRARWLALKEFNDYKKTMFDKYELSVDEIIKQFDDYKNDIKVEIYLREYSKEITFDKFKKIIKELGEGKCKLFHEQKISPLEDEIKLFKQYDIQTLKLFLAKGKYSLLKTDIFYWESFLKLSYNAKRTLLQILSIDLNLEKALLQEERNSLRKSIDSLETRDSDDEEGDALKEKLIKLVSSYEDLYNQINTLSKIKGASVKFIIEKFEIIKPNTNFLIKANDELNHNLKMNIDFNTLIKMNEEQLGIIKNEEFVKNISEIFKVKISHELVIELLEYPSNKLKFLFDFLKINTSDKKKIFSGYNLQDLLKLEDEKLELLFSMYSQDLYKHYEINAKAIINLFDKHKIAFNNWKNDNWIIPLLHNIDKQISPKNFNYSDSILFRLLNNENEKTNLFTSKNALEYFLGYLPKNTDEFLKLLKFSNKKLALLFSKTNVEFWKTFSIHNLNKRVFEDLDEDRLELFINNDYVSQVFKIVMIHNFSADESLFLKLDLSKLKLIASQEGKDYIFKTNIYKKQDKFEEFCKLDYQTIKNLLNRNIINALDYGFDHDFFSKLSSQRIEVFAKKVFVEYIKTFKSEALINDIKYIFNDNKEIDIELLNLITSSNAIKLYEKGLTSIKELAYLKNDFRKFNSIKLLLERKEKLALILNEENFNELYEKFQNIKNIKVHDISTKSLKSFNELLNSERQKKENEEKAIRKELEFKEEMSIFDQTSLNN
ncbi:MAG TPA: hypothetical protein PKD00_08100 [Burkholderiales bacterium]|nr:hypothetical protein [Burkholderiales bacterium]